MRGMVAPDVYVIFGAPNRERQSFVSWDEGKLPDFVLEILSSSTWRHDISAKRALYQRLGVLEFWVADPMGAFVHPRVQGYRLVAGVTRPSTRCPESAGSGARSLGWSCASRTDCCASTTPRRVATSTTSMAPLRHYDNPKPHDGNPRPHYDNLKPPDDKPTPSDSGSTPSESGSTPPDGKPTPTDSGSTPHDDKPTPSDESPTLHGRRRNAARFDAERRITELHRKQ